MRCAQFSSLRSGLQLERGYVHNGECTWGKEYSGTKTWITLSMRSSQAHLCAAQKMSESWRQWWRALSCGAKSHYGARNKAKWGEIEPTLLWNEYFVPFLWIQRFHRLSTGFTVVMLLGTWYYYAQVDMHYNPCAEITIYRFIDKKPKVLFQISSSKLKITTSGRLHVSFPKHISPFQFALLGLHNNALPVPNELICYTTIIGQLPYHAIVVCLPAKCWN